jgi:hypothetical protein
MSKAEIIAELQRLSPADLAEVQAKLDELTGETWHEQADLSYADKSTMNAAIADNEKNPDSGRSWDQVKARIQTALG